MGKSLVIVESPAKVKKIQSFLGDDYIVKASIGHIRDLPVRDLGVDLTTFKPTYVVSKDKEKVVQGLRSAMKRCDHVIIATDLDREGEAIGWHLLSLLKPSSHSRAIFNEITKNAVTKAITNAGVMDMKMVAAQETRRVIDRLVGYQVSPVLTRAAASPIALSAGRVQSVALRIICENDLSIVEFTPEDHYKIIAHFTLDTDTNNTKKTWTAQWDFKHLISPQATNTLWQDKIQAQSFFEALKYQTQFDVQSIDKSESKSHAPCAFTTSLLQQAASNTLGFSTSQTMQVAQKIFEEGLITYHRTDNKNLSDDSIAEAREWITHWQTKKNIGNMLPAKPNKWKNTGDAQEAHEAIRPTSFNNLGAEISDPKQQALYRLIWKRAIASQIKAAVYDVTTIHLVSQAQLNGARQPFIAKGRVQVDAGWRALTGSDQSDESDKDTPDQQSLPMLTQGQQLSASHSVLDALKTKPPARFTEATLVKTLEKKGVGRPSTFASIIATLLKRQYVNIEKRKMYPTKLGKQINGGLVGKFSFLEIAFTSTTEKRLDEIAQGKLKYKEVVSALQSTLLEEIKTFTDNGITINTGVKTWDCPNCDCGKLVKRKNKRNKPFFTCNNYPACSTALPLKNNAPDFDFRPPEASEHPCPKCNKKLIERQGKYGPYFTCEDNKKCKHIMNSVDGKPVEKEPKQLSEHDCPKCQKHKLILRKGANGDFYGCSGFPKCKHTCQVDDIVQPA